MPREEADAHLMCDLLEVEDEAGEVDVAEERGCRPFAGGDVSFDLSSEAADTTEEGSLLLAHASTTNDRPSGCILASAKMNRHAILLKRDEGVPASVRLRDVLTTCMLKRNSFVVNPEHEEAADSHEASFLDEAAVREAALNLLEVVLDDPAFGRSLMKCEGTPLDQDDDLIRRVGVEAEDEMTLSNGLEVLDEGVRVLEVDDVGPDVVPTSGEVTTHGEVGRHEDAPCHPLRAEGPPRLRDGLKFDAKTSFAREVLNVTMSPRV